jgi:hypothetical protein
MSTGWVPHCACRAIVIPNCRQTLQVILMDHVDWLGDSPNPSLGFAGQSTFL